MNSTGRISTIRMEPESLADFDERIAAMSVDDLRAEFGKLLGITVDAVAKTAKVVVRLEKLGFDLAELNNPLVYFYRLVGEGHLLAQLVSSLFGQPARLRMLTSLPPSDQKAVANGKAFPLAVCQNGQWTHKSIVLLNVPSLDHFRQLVARDHIRDEAEQRLYLELKQTKKVVEPPRRTRHFEFDRERAVAKFLGGRGAFITKDELVAAVKALS
jgi:hypothetical protein